jgi:superfamily I DNA/RNA helicase
LFKINIISIFAENLNGMSEYVIKHGNTIFTPSIYQENILRFAREGVGDAFINACAGASKTTILENIIYQLPKDKKICFIAFNKSIVAEMVNRMSDVENDLRIMTYHSLGYSILKENFPRKDFNVVENKYENYLRQNLLNLTQHGEVESLGNDYYSYFKNILLLIGYARYYHKSNINGIERIASEYELSLFRDECIVCKKVLDWGRDNFNIIDYTDMIWMVNEHNLTTKKNKYDIILIDEAQDTSIMQQQMTERCMNRGCRRFIVGDKHQSINVWCGSDFNAVEKFKNNKTVEFELPITYRCPKKVVELAKIYSPNIQCDENAIEGEVNYNVSLNAPCGNDMVLCRNTAPLIMQFQQYLKNNKKCFINGSEDISNTLKTLIISSGAQFIDTKCLTQIGLIPKLFSMINSIIQKLLREGLSIEEAYSNMSVVDLYDNINCIRMLSGNLTTTEELIAKIDDIFKDRSTDGVMLSTVHKAKGLEADNVFILCPSLLPSKFVKKDWEIESERHIVYVAYTRAKKTLNFMEEDYRHSMTNASFNYDNMIDEITYMSTILGGHTPLPQIPSKKTKKETIKKEKENKDSNNETPVIKKKKGGLKFDSIF